MSTIPRDVRRTAIGLAVGGVIAVATAQSAAAHVSIAESEAEAGAYTLLTFGVPHGCEDSPTTEVRIQMPETIPQVAPTVNANWDVAKVMATLDEPIEVGHGEQITERVSEVVYTATTPLPDGYRDAFVLSVKMPDDAAGQTLYFPTIQTCEVGETAWIELPSEGASGEELEAPAPSIAVVEASAGDEHGDDGAANGTADGASAEDASVESGDGAAVTATDDDDSSNLLAIAALVVGLAGLAVGGFALVRSGKR